MAISQLLGFIGAILVLAAYFPQVAHLIKEHCSAGISLWTYGIWLVSSLLLFSHAFMIGDLVFIVLQIASMALTLTVFIFAFKYRRATCQSHA